MLLFLLHATIALGRNPEKGAMTTINCAINPTLNSQQAVYYSNCRPAQANDIARYVLGTDGPGAEEASDSWGSTYLN